jgi:hypothetical protein
MEKACKHYNYYNWAWTDNDSCSYVQLRFPSYYVFTNEQLPFTYCISGSPTYYYFSYDTIVNTESSKTKLDGTPLKWWEEYVLGTNPLDSNDVFKVSINVGNDGVPSLTWEPNMGGDRVYQIFGKKNIYDDWVYIDDGDLSPYRFFMIGVDLP